MIEKPANVAADPFRSAKWDELVAGRDFAQPDAPALALLVSWYQVIERCMDDIGANGGVQVAYQNDMGDIMALPQLSTMKQASAEIRALNKQLGIDDSSAPKVIFHELAQILGALHTSWAACLSVALMVEAVSSKVAACNGSYKSEDGPPRHRGRRFALQGFTGCSLINLFNSVGVYTKHLSRAHRPSPFNASLAFPALSGCFAEVASARG